jgi:hypothetical protein
MEPLGEDIRWIFGTFILAFVVSELGKELGRTFVDSKLAPQRGPRLAHLGYTLVVVVTSFWGWSIAIKGGLYADHGDNRSLFQYTNWLFLLDIAIFMTYYLLLVGIEREGMKSAQWALRCTVAIFCAYLAWDLLVACRHLFDSQTFIAARRTTGWLHVLASLAGASLAGLAARTLTKAKDGRTSIYGLYGGLALLMLGFRFMTVAIHAPTDAQTLVFRTLWILCVLSAALIAWFIPKR